MCVIYKHTKQIINLYDFICIYINNKYTRVYIWLMTHNGRSLVS